MRLWHRLIDVRSGRVAHAVLLSAYLRERLGLTAQHRVQEGQLQVVVYETRDWSFANLETYQQIAQAFLAGAGEHW